MPTAPDILVTGATGSTGRATADALAAQGVSFRPMSRSASPNEFAVQADFDDVESLRAALRGVRAAYLVTPSTEHAEAQQKRFIDLAVEAGVRHLVLLSQLGSVGDARVSLVDVRDIGEMASRALTASAPMGIQTLTGPEALTHSELAAHLSSATGHVIRFEDTPPAAFGEMLTGILPPWQVEGLLEDYAHYARGEAADISSAVPDALGRPARRFADFAAENAAAFGGDGSDRPDR